MKNTFGNSVSVTLFGESHGKAIGVVIDGLAPGMTVDTDFISKQLSRRRPQGNISTPRKEKDEFEILSGVFDGKTTGTPLCIMIPNEDKKSADYDKTRFLARPSHADFTANAKYHGFEDYRGGGHFSGRITAALVAAGAVVMPTLAEKGIILATHIKNIADVYDRDFKNTEEDILSLLGASFPTLCDKAENEMKQRIEEAKVNCDSIGGVLETVVLGMPAGVGEPWFDTVESTLSHILFSIPAVKGVEFGAGFAFADMKGSEANDAFCADDGVVSTKTNNNGGVNGGITNGMPIVFKTVIKPTPTIARPQQTINMQTLENTEITAIGRHDPCIVHRAAPVVDAVTALALCDMLATRFGTDWQDRI